MQDRAIAIPSYLTLIATCLAGIVHYSWWAALAGASALALISLLGRIPAERTPVVRTEPAEPIMSVASLMNAVAFSGAAYGFGQFTGWLWSV